MKTLKKIITKNWFWLTIILPIVIQIIVWTCVFKGHDYYVQWKTGIYNDGVEVGRFLQLNEMAQDQDRAERDFILERLAYLESSNCKIQKILDTNNKYSLGCYHFQVDTVKDMYRRYYKQNISTERAVEIAYDKDLSKKLAETAIFEKGEKYHWFNSMRKLSNLGLLK